MKKYPKWEDFPTEQIYYGSGGIYLENRKYRWPDLEVCFPKEILTWAGELIQQGYEIPKEYKDEILKLISENGEK